MHLSAIHHVALIVSDYAKSRDFYVDLLELPVIQEHYRPQQDDYLLSLQIGTSQLEIFGKNNPPQRLTQPEAAGLRHLAFGVDDIDTTVADLASKGIKCEPIRIDPYTGARTTFFRDPDDLPLELYETIRNQKTTDYSIVPTILLKDNSPSQSAFY